MSAPNVCYKIIMALITYLYLAATLPAHSQDLPTSRPDCICWDPLGGTDYLGVFVGTNVNEFYKSFPSGVGLGLRAKFVSMCQDPTLCKPNMVPMCGTVSGIVSGTGSMANRNNSSVLLLTKQFGEVHLMKAEDCLADIRREMGK
jgi:hypothetical protein